MSNKNPLTPLTENLSRQLSRKYGVDHDDLSQSALLHWVEVSGSLVNKSQGYQRQVFRNAMLDEVRRHFRSRMSELPNDGEAKDSYIYADYLTEPQQLMFDILKEGHTVASAARSLGIPYHRAQKLKNELREAVFVY